MCLLQIEHYQILRRKRKLLANFPMHHFLKN